MESNRKFTILLIEDNIADQGLFLRALKDLPFDVKIMSDGVRALEYLHGGPNSISPPQVGLIVVDLNLPGIDGVEILKELRAENRLNLKTTPVIVLSTSSNLRDVSNCYQSGANAYITKASDLNLYLKSVRDSALYWSEIVYQKPL